MKTQLIIIASSTDGLSPEIEMFFTNEKAIKRIGELLTDQYPIKPEPTTKVQHYVQDYYEWVGEENDNQCDVDIDYKILEIDHISTVKITEMK